MEADNPEGAEPLRPPMPLKELIRITSLFSSYPQEPQGCEDVYALYAIKIGVLALPRKSLHADEWAFGDTLLRAAPNTQIGASAIDIAQGARRVSGIAERRIF